MQLVELQALEDQALGEQGCLLQVRQYSLLLLLQGLQQGRQLS